MTVDRMKLALQTVKDNIAIMEMHEEPDDAGYYLQLEHEKFVAKAIEKQIPQKPIPHKVKVDKILIGNGYWGKGTTIYKCPNCGEYITYYGKHCGDCGQAIDWSDTYERERSN